MERFQRRYRQLCKRNGSEVNDSILSCFSKSSNSNEDSLDFASCNMSDIDCMIISQCLAEDRFFSIVKFTDCLLTERCCQTILRALYTNTSVRRIDFKGNNIRLLGAEEINRLLKQTTMLTSLNLEWNGVGMWEAGVRAIAEGLALNQTLLHLDLRNNQISHESVIDLAASLRKNKTLLTMDLRWNNAGIIGARALVGALKHNTTIIQMKLAGNNIPSDILQTIHTVLGRNADRYAATERQETITSAMRNELVAMEESKQMQVTQLVAQLSREKQFQESLSNSTYEKIANLKSVLEERQNVAEKLSERCKEAEDSLQQVNTTLLEKSKEIEDVVSESQNAQMHLNEIISQLQEKCSALDRNLNKAHQESESAKHQFRSQFEELESSVSLKNAEISRLQNQLQKQSEEFSSQLESADKQFKKDREFFKKSSEERVNELQDKVMRLETSLATEEEAMNLFKAKTIGDKVRMEEEMATAKTKSNEEESSRLRQYEEKNMSLIRSRDELQLRMDIISAENSELKSQTASNGRELQALMRNNDNCKHELNQAQLSHKHESDRMRTDLDKEKRQNAELCNKLATLEVTVKELQSKLSLLRTEKDSDVEKLQKSLHNRDLELLSLREDEVRRAGMLQSAIQNYIGFNRSPLK